MRRAAVTEVVEITRDRCKTDFPLHRLLTRHIITILAQRPRRDLDAFEDQIEAFCDSVPTVPPVIKRALHNRIVAHVKIAAAVVTWLKQFENETERIRCFDCGGNWELLCDLLDGPPPDWQAVHVGGIIDTRRAEQYYQTHAGRHHALVDVRANRYAVEEGSDPGNSRTATVELLPDGAGEIARIPAKFDMVIDGASPA